MHQSTDVLGQRIRLLFDGALFMILFAVVLILMGAYYLIQLGNQAYKQEWGSITTLLLLLLLLLLLSIIPDK